MLSHSRLTKKLEERNIRYALIYIFLTLILSFLLIFIGIPILIKAAIFLGQLKSASLFPEKNDTIPPPPPRIITSLDATNSASLNLKGYSEPETEIKIFNSGSYISEVITDNNGLFTIDNIQLTPGNNEITAIARDKSGNESQLSTPVVIIYDVTPPKLEISEPSNNSTITGIDNKITIKGKTEEKVKVTINDRMVIVDSEGKFETQYLLKEGENIFTILAIDIAGNQTKEELKINYSP